MNDVRAVVFSDQPGERYRAGRTVRALIRCKLSVTEAVGPSPGKLAQALIDAEGPVWLVRAGCWPAVHVAPDFPPSSVTGRSVCAFGIVRTRRDPNGCYDQAWHALLSESGGDFSLLADLSS